LTGSNNDVVELNSILSTLPKTTPPSKLSSLLSNLLYTRRFFPYGCHCVVCGYECDRSIVYNYDGIGSMEEVESVVIGGGGAELEGVSGSEDEGQDGEEELVYKYR